MKKNSTNRPTIAGVSGVPGRAQEHGAIAEKWREMERRERSARLQAEWLRQRNAGKVEVEP